jgi:hypothetical protein
MSLNRWLIVILMMAFFLALNPLGAQAQAGPYRHFGPHSKYHHPHGKAYGWHGSRHHAFDRYQKHFRRCGKGPRHLHHFAHQAGPPPVAYVAPVTPIIGVPYSQPQPFYSQPATPGFSGQLNWNF